MSFLEHPRISTAVSFLVTGVVIYFAAGYGLLALTSINHVYDLSPSAAARLGYVFWWLAALPAAWLVSLLSAVLELRKNRSSKRLLLWLAAPLCACVFVLTSAWLTAWFITLQKS